MKLNAPTKLIFLISAVLAIAAFLSIHVTIPYISGHAFWTMTAAYVVLAAGNIFKGL